MRAVVLLVSVLASLGDASCAGSVQVVCVRTATKENVVNGIETLASAFGPKETMDRLEAAIRSKGMTIFARIDHAAGAASVGLVLRPTELLVFGNAKAGTPLMQVNQAIGLDLPLRALVWQDAAGVTFLSFDDPRWIVSRHEEDAALAGVAREMAGGLLAVAKAATQDP
jgi:uncharacterized protein (DUF302 family)